MVLQSLRRIVVDFILILQPRFCKFPALPSSEEGFAGGGLAASAARAIKLRMRLDMLEERLIKDSLSGQLNKLELRKTRVHAAPLPRTSKDSRGQCDI